MTVPPAEKMHGSHSEPPGSDGGGNLIARLQQKTPALERKTDNDSAKQDELAHHLAAIVESSDDAIVSKTLDGVIKSWNPGAQRIFGWSANEAIGKSLTLIIPPERLDEETHILETLRGGGSIERFETIRVAKDGRRIDVSLSVSPVRDAEGHVVGASNIARDITIRKSTEAALRRNEKLLAAQKEAFQAAVNSAPLEASLGILVREAIDQIGEGTRCGFFLADAEGRTLRHLYGMPDSYADCVDGFVVGPDTIACGLAAHIRQPVISSDISQDPRWKDWRWLADRFGYRACWSFPVQTVAERVVGTFAMYFRDPREPSQRDRDLAATLTQSAAIIISQHQQTEERDRAVSVLEQNEAKLIAADRQKNEFLAMLGHELRNPLAPIRNASEVLARLKSGDHRAGTAIDMLRRQTGQLTRLVDDLLDVGRITQGHIRLQCESLDVAAVIAQALETVEPLLHEKHHHLAITYSHEPLYVSGDFVRLVQCVVNLLTNAAKYTEPDGKIRIESRADVSQAVITVADNGPGIAAELLPRVFDLFVQSERTLGRSQGGLGVGLSIVKRLIEMHGGKVRAQSPGPGEGATFEIRLPRVAQLQPIVSDEAAPKAKQRRVLIVDDNADAADSLCMLLTLHGHSAQVAYASKDVLARIEAFQPDVALLDIGLPEMDGYQLAENLRAMPHLNGLRLIAVTGYGQLSDRQRALAAGFDGHVVKPIDPSALERILTPRVEPNR